MLHTLKTQIDLVALQRRCLDDLQSLNIRLDLVIQENAIAAANGRPLEDEQAGRVATHRVLVEQRTRLLHHLAIAQDLADYIRRHPLLSFKAWVASEDWRRASRSQIAARVACRRRTIGLKQVELAQRAGVSQAMVSRLEMGQSLMGGNLERILRFLASDVAT